MNAGSLTHVMSSTTRATPRNVTSSSGAGSAAGTRGRAYRVSRAVRNVLPPRAPGPHLLKIGRTRAAAGRGAHTSVMRGSNVSFRAALAAFIVTTAVVALPAQEPAADAAAAQETRRPTFRSSLDLVSVAVVVRTPDGRLVTDLKSGDFEVLDRGAAQPIVQFQRGDDAHARLALLVDSSGSMVLGAKRERSRIATDLLAAGFKSLDAATVFSFDSRLRRLTPFTRDVDTLREAVTRLEPWGVTSLYDAIVGTIESVVEESPRTRALLLLTDGIDTASVRTPV